MNGKQRIALRAGGVVILLLAIFPPWRMQSYAPAGNITLSCDFRAGHSFLFRPPDPVLDGKPILGDALIDLPQLAAEWAIAVVLTWLASSFLRDARSAAAETGTMPVRR